MIFGCINVFGTSGIISSDRLVRTLPQSVMNAEGHSTSDVHRGSRERGGVAGGCGGAATDDPVDRGGETPNIYEKRVAAFQRGLEEMGFVDLSRRAIGANVHRRLCERCTGVLQFRRRRYDRLNEL
jgi:hypothetical protein